MKQAILRRWKSMSRRQRNVGCVRVVEADSVGLRHWQQTAAGPGAWAEANGASMINAIARTNEKTLVKSFTPISVSAP